MAETTETTNAQDDERDLFLATLDLALDEGAGCVLLVRSDGNIRIRPTPELRRPGGFVARVEGHELVVVPTPGPNSRPEDADLEGLSRGYL